MNTAAVNFREIAGIVEDQCHRRGQESSAFAAAPPVILQHQAGEEINNQQLNHQRGTANHPDNDSGHEPNGAAVDKPPAPPFFAPACAPQKAERRPAVHGPEGDHQSQRNGAQKRHNKQFERLQKTHVQCVNDDWHLLLYQTPVHNFLPMEHFSSEFSSWENVESRERQIPLSAETESALFACSVQFFIVFRSDYCSIREACTP